MSLMQVSLSDNTSIDFQQFRQDQERLMQAFTRYFYTEKKILPCEVYPYPLLVSNRLAYQVKEAHQLLINVLRKVVFHFFTDLKIQRKMALSKSIFALLWQIKDQPYHIGSIRPDFLISCLGDLKICEINARYPSNAFLFTEIIQDCLWNQYSHLRRVAQKTPINSTQVFSRFFNHFKPIYILRDQEKSLELDLLKKSIIQQKYNQFSPEILSSSFFDSPFNSAINFSRKKPQIILNFTQKEILSLTRQQIKYLIKATYFNDLRTIFLVHNKKLLCVLSDPDIMLNYIHRNDFERLQGYLIPSEVIDKKHICMFETQPNRWILKKTDQGKGKQIFTGKKLLYQLKNNLISTHDYIVQPYLKQRSLTVSYYPDTLTTQNRSHRTLYVVGSILSFNGKLIGSGLFRGSHQTIINATSKNTILFMPFYTKKESHLL